MLWGSTKILDLEPHELEVSHQEFPLSMVNGATFENLTYLVHLKVQCPEQSSFVDNQIR